MSNLPNALRVGTPGPSGDGPRRSGTGDRQTPIRSNTGDDLPASLRSNTVENVPVRSGTNEGLPASLRSNTGDFVPTRSDTGEGRLSDLLSSARRKSSAASISTMHTDTPYAPSRYGSIRRDVSPPEEEDLVSDRRSSWAPTRTSSVSSKYALPALPTLPALPSLSEDQPLESSPFIVQGRRHEESQEQQQQHQPSRTRSMMNRIGSVRTGRTRSRYGRLNDLDEETGDTESINVDISGFDGGPMIELYDLSRSPGAMQASNGLGKGMGHVLNASLKPSLTVRHTRGDSLGTPDLRMAIQHEAQKQGEIVAVEEEVFDLSGFDGGDQPSTRATSIFEGSTGETKKSYFFPEDPDKPSWKPISMRWPYITILVVIAVVLAGITEFLCQKSLHNPNGLLHFKSATEVTVLDYFVWKYLPTIILVTYGVAWQVVDYEVKRLEPYYQLSKREGATARDSLNLDYLTAIAWFIPFRAIKYKQWAVVYSSLGSLIAGTLLAVLQSASIVTDPKRPQDAQDNPGRDVRVLMNPVFSRLLEATLGIVAIAGIALMVALRRTSGLLSDPKGIAGVASMATKSHILADFKGLDTASNSVIHDRLRRRRYNLHKSSLWQGEFVRESENPPLSDKKENPHPLMLRPVAGLPFMLYIVLVGTLFPVFLFDPRANMITSEVPWMLTALATGVKLGWNAIDIELRVMAPYYILWRRHAPPRTLTLDYTGTVPGYLTFKAVINRHWLIASVSFGAVLCEILTVCASSFTVDGRKFITGGQNNNEGGHATQTFRSFWISVALASGILLYLLCTAVIIYIRRGHIFLPRQPGSIAGVLAYIHQSKMLDDFIDTELLDSKKMTKHLESLGKTYALGWFNGRDKEDHCGVEQEKIDASYKYGVKWNNSRMVGMEVGNWEHY
jgi:hypothetical protein